MNTNQEKFDTYVCIGDSIDIYRDGKRYTAILEFDEHYRIDDDDCHNTDQSVTGCDDEQFERVLACRQAWFDNEWLYCGVTLYGYGVNSQGCEEIDDFPIASLWGIEANYPGSDNSHLTGVALQLAEESA